MFRSRSLLVAAVGLWMAHPVPGQEPAPIRLERGSSLETAVQTTENQRMADLIASRLQKSGRLTKFTIDVSYQDGVVDLAGGVADEAQKEEALLIVRTMPGIIRVVDNITVNSITPVQARVTPVAQAPVQPPARTLPPTAQATPVAPPLTQAPTNVLPPTIGGTYGSPYGMQPPAVPGSGRGPAPAPPPTPYVAGNGAMMMEPTPINQMAPPSAYDLNPPHMPPHAWPTYAPYNNYSRVAYPTHYPYQAWPFIGPFYPFPKVPLGWRSVKLEWEDGHWWYKKCATQHDWWRIRYW